MRIVYYHYLIAKMGGVERVFTEKMNYLADICRYDVFLITLYQGNHPLYYKLSPKVKHIDMGIRSDYKYKMPKYKRFYIEHKYNKQICKKFQEIISEINPDIITAVAGEASTFILEIQTKAKIIMESHQARYLTGTHHHWLHPIQLMKNIKMQIAMQKIERKSDAIVTLTKADAKNWNKNKTIVIPNVVAPKVSKISTHTHKTVIAAGRLVYQKGFDQLIDVWKIVNESKKDWTLKIFGEGRLHHNLQRRIKSYNLENYIKIMPPINNIEQELLKSSIYTLSSRYEGYALVLVEAMQCGVPCVAFNCPYGPAEIIEDGKNSILVQNGNIKQLANAILKLIEDEELRKKMSQAAIEKAKEYLPEKVMPKWTKLFNELTGK